SVTNASICQGDSYTFNGATYTAAGTYTKHLINAVGCDSTATLNLIIKLPTSSITNAAICQGDSYTFDGVLYSAAGTYIRHLTNVAGCDSTATLNLSVKLPTVSTTNAVICQGDSYTFNGTVYNTAGTYIKHLINVAGCDSAATLNLVVKLPTTSITNASICQGDTYTFNGTVYSATGSYNNHFINSVGCDSTATLNLMVKLPTSSVTNASICQGDSCIFNGATYTTAGTYAKHSINAVGCDSTATLNLTIKLPTSSITNAAICQGDSYTFDGVLYSAAGTYIKHLTNVAGCDSTATLNLMIKLPTASNTIKAICSKELPYNWNGLIFNAAGSQTAVLINSVGCDSVATLKLIVNFPTTSSAKKTICSQDLPFVWNGLTFNEAGTKSVTLTSAVGCDSVATLELNVNPTTGSTTEYTTCPSALPFVWNGMSYNSAGKYTSRLTNANGCDSIATLILNVKTPLTSTTTDYICSSLLPYVWNKKLYYKSGTYTAQLINSAGCDSIATLMLTVVSPSASVSKEAVSSTELPYVWNKMAFTETGTYTSPEKYINSMGCDSIAKLILKVNLSTSADTYASVCASDLPYVWNGTLYDAAGTYTKVMTNVLGEDVTVTLYLKVIAAQTTSQTIHIFSGESYTINGHAYDKAGVYTDDLKTVNGCDSTVVTDLSFINIPNTITPNKDGHNDVFMKGWHIKLYNRNGILMYDGMEGWDGTYNNRPVSKDTYFYVLFYTSGAATKSKEGYLMVIP
ncbi:MAG TPA: gliding motility-associated C-terminal domain-containing protein, partial [Paludibacter sp.]|nr:gliding motility-associated C-terminal domain-containing protein [Paludibacter sp.]